MSEPLLEQFFRACAAGDLPALRRLLDQEPTLARARDHGTTGLHRAVPHPDAVRLLLEHGADPNARDEGDNALPLHFAAGGGQLESVRALLDAGSDVHGFGDAHRLEVIGWATVFADPHRSVLPLLLERGARHHVFSAIALGDQALLRRVVAEDASGLSRRLSPTEQEQTALHYVIAPPDGLVGGTFRTGSHYSTLAALIELGAELEARDAKGRTPLEVALLQGDHEAMRLLHAAGAKLPELPAAPRQTPAELAAAIRELTPMLVVQDMATTIAWYEAVGFELSASHGEDGRLDWAEMRFGAARLMFVPPPQMGPWKPRSGGVSLWIRTDRLDELYALLKQRQLERASCALTGEPPAGPELPFKLDLYTAFYGQRELGIRDPNGVELMFFQPLDQGPQEVLPPP